MAAKFMPWLVVAALGVPGGVALGRATAMSLGVHRPPAPEAGAFADRAFERGLRWAHAHGILDSRDCPEPDQYFLSGCVTGSDTGG